MEQWRSPLRCTFPLHTGKLASLTLSTIHHPLSTALQHLARIRLHHQPDLAARLQSQGVTRGGREVYFEFRSAIHAGNHHHVALLELSDRASENIARAQPLRRRRRQQNVAGANSDAQRSRRRPARVEPPERALSRRRGRSSSPARGARRRSGRRRCSRSRPVAPPSPTCGRCSTSCGEPCAMIRPASSAMTLSPSAKTSSR